MSKISRSIVRLETTYWFDGNSLYQKKEITFLKRRSTAYNWVLEDAYKFGAENIITHIVNLNSTDDGVYEIVPVNIREHENGDDCDYKLVEYKIFLTGDKKETDNEKQETRNLERQD